MWPFPALLMKQKCDKMISSQFFSIIIIIFYLFFNSVELTSLYVQSGYSCTNSRSREEFKDNGRND